MYIINKGMIIKVYPFIDDEQFAPFSGYMLISRDTDCAPDVAGHLQLNMVFANGMTREMWEKLKEAGDKAFELADAGEFSTEDLIGKTLEEASAFVEAFGYRIRATHKDGCPGIVTRDQMPNRINVAMVDGKITEILNVG